MGTLLFNRVLNGVLNGISTSTCSIPKRFDSQPHREKAACVACHKVNKCTSHPKQKTQNGQATFHFPGGLCVFLSCRSS